MPKQTYFNLPEEKRKRIEDAALCEFADKDYRDVHVTAIISAAGIADGSFYQYFTDKKDLFLHMLGTISREKTAYMKNVAAEEHMREAGFAAAVKNAIYIGVLYGLERPLHMRFLERMLKSPVNDAAIEEVRCAALDYWNALILERVASGELRGDIPAGLMSRALSAAGEELSRYVAEESGLADLASRPDSRELLKEELQRFAEQFAGMFSEGFLAR